MTLINLTTLFGGPDPLHNIYSAPVSFRGDTKTAAFGFGTVESYNDKFSTNPLKERFKTKAEIELIAKSNPRIMAILKEHNIPLEVNISALEKLEKGHLKDVRVIAAKIYSALPDKLKSEVNLSDIQQAAMLHDYGKVLIPKNILDKEGRLTPEEKKIMDLHSEFGYELLKQQGVKEEVLKLIKYHHQKPDGNGYPEVDDGFIFGMSSQIITAADKFSALTEDRSYHKACTKEEALGIIAQDVENGVISKEVFDALNKAVK